MYHFGFLIIFSFKAWESFWPFSAPRNSWVGPPLCSVHAGSCQNWHGLLWTLSKLRSTEGDSDQDHEAVAVLWLTLKHSHFEHHSSLTLLLMEICLTNTVVLQPFWGLIQCPLRWDNAHWFQWAVNYILYFWLKNSFNVLPSLYRRVSLRISPSPSKLQILQPVHILQLDSCSEEQHPQQPPSQSLFITPPALSLSLIKTGTSHFSSNIPNQLLITYTE